MKNPTVECIYTMHVHSSLNLTFINLEDDASILVKRIEDKYLHILKSWYSKSTTIIDVEHLDIEFVGINERPIILASDKDKYSRNLFENPFGYQHSDIFQSIKKKDIVDDTEDIIDTEVLQIDYDMSYNIYNLHGFLGFVYNYDFLNKKILEKEKFRNEYIPLYVKKIVLEKHMQSYHMSDKNKNNTEIFDKFEERRKSLFDFEKVGIVIPSIFCSSYFDKFPQKINTNQTIISTESSRQNALNKTESQPHITFSDNIIKGYSPIPYNNDTDLFAADYESNFVVNVILNYFDYSTFVITEHLSNDEEHILREYQEYGFVKLITHQTKNKSIVDQIKSFFCENPCQTP
jgi:hypothetical protein